MQNLLKQHAQPLFVYLMIALRTAIALLFFRSHLVLGQGVWGPGSLEFNVKDCYNNFKGENTTTVNILQPNVILTGERVWRIINLEVTENKEIFRSGNKCVSVGLFEVIKFGMLEKHLSVFMSEEFTEKDRILASQSLQALSYSDTSEVDVFDSDGNQTKSTEITKGYYYSNDISAYILKEDWIFNTRVGKTEKIVIAIAPIVYDKKTGKQKPLFWLYYPEWQQLFSVFEAKNFYSHSTVSYHDVFQKKFFVSQISKSSNVFDRKLGTVHHGEDLYLENERIKEKARQATTDLFEH